MGWGFSLELTKPDRGWRACSPNAHTKDDRPPTFDEVRALNRPFEDGLMKLNPNLKFFMVDHTALAQANNVPIEDARRRHMNSELNDLEVGVKVSLYGTCSIVTIPYLRDGADMQRSWRRAWEYVELLARMGGFVVIDSSSGNVLDPERDHHVPIREYLKRAKRIYGTLSGTRSLANGSATL